ncbi:hypothetical protein [Mesorhizobium sp. M0522]|uniref:hypothetical protein n=1 Tax=Mesorhizobium sp. M0522 TaxID=2956958 RepID=UPI00333B2D25
MTKTTRKDSPGMAGGPFQRNEGTFLAPISPPADGAIHCEWATVVPDAAYAPTIAQPGQT